MSVVSGINDAANQFLSQQRLPHIRCLVSAPIAHRLQLVSKRVGLLRLLVQRLNSTAELNEEGLHGKPTLP